MIFFKNIRMVPLKRFFGSRFYSDGKCGGLITVKNMNQNLKEIEYAVRGPIPNRALQIEKELSSGVKKPFKEVIRANLGDSQAMGQKPITFFRQVLALATYPELLSNKSFPEDAVRRAKEILSGCRGKSLGAYTESFGIEIIRKNVENFIKRRDNFDSNWQNIFLSSGASEAIKNVLKIVNQKVDGKRPGVMIPIPQYPLYTATLSEFGMTLIGYYLDEKTNWGLGVEELTRSYKEAQKQCNPRAIVVINPGNPTGQVLTRENIEQVIKFAYQNKLMLMADEVYQENILAEGSKFYSFKKVTNEMGSPYDKMELTSFMSCSKGYMGECGLRGGYCELTNFDPEVITHFSKCISSSLCPTSVGQCLIDCVVRPPVQGDPSYELFAKEKAEILNNHREKAEMVHHHLNKVEGMSCNIVQGAMYAFPKIEIPPKALEEAKKKNMAADSFYCFQLLESTGICVVPGSGFKQQPGTYHFRTTLLPPKEALLRMLEVLAEFHKQFLRKYG